MCRLPFRSWQPTCACLIRLSRTRSSHQCCASLLVSRHHGASTLGCVIPQVMICHISTDTGV